MPGFIKHAQTLTLEQWRDEISLRFQDTELEINSFPQREPMLSLVKFLCLDTESSYPFHANWIIHSVSLSEKFCSFPITCLFLGLHRKIQIGTTRHHRSAAGADRR